MNSSIPYTGTSTAPSRSSRHASPFDVVWMLAWREWVRFFRQPFRVVAALGQPILFWILFGTGMHSSFRGDAGGADFMSFFMPGTLAMILLFTAIFATITIIEDRREGFLQSVLVASSPRWTIALGKILGCSAIAWGQSLVFLAIAVATGSVPLSSSLLVLAGYLMLVAVFVSSLGVCCAWPMNSTQEFHSLMNLLLMPMWLLSGAFFPTPSLTGNDPMGQVVLHWIMRCNPMTYAVSGIRYWMFGHVSDSAFWIPSANTSLCVTILFTIGITILAFTMVRRNQRGEFA
jgi:ABC-2 type transport system permease protein